MRIFIIFSGKSDEITTKEVIEKLREILDFNSALGHPTKMNQ